MLKILLATACLIMTTGSVIAQETHENHATDAWMGDFCNQRPGESVELWNIRRYAELEELRQTAIWQSVMQYRSPSNFTEEQSQRDIVKEQQNQIKEMHDQLLQQQEEIGELRARTDDQ